MDRSAGSRRTRRLTTAAAVGIVATIALVAAFRPHASSHGRRPVLVTGRLVYGMTRAQVLQRLGPPAKKVGVCWEYAERVTSHRRHRLDAERICFSGGGYAYDYPEIDGWWRYPDGSRRRA